jgi:AraC-like DNA-binding protein
MKAGDRGQGFDRAKLANGPQVFSTRGLPSNLKFEVWRELCLQDPGVEVSTDSPEAFDGELAMRIAGPVKLVTATTGPTSYVRTASLARNHDDHFSLTLEGHHYAVGSPAEETAQAEVGGAFFLAHGREFSLSAKRPLSTSVLVVERQALLHLLPAGADPGTTVLRPGPVLQLIRGYVPVLSGGNEPLPSQSADTMGGHIVDLIALLLKPSRDAFEVIEGGGLKAARTKAVLEAIMRDYARPDLSAAMIGLKLGVSARQVHRLLEETPKTFYEYLLESRLQRSWQLLSGPGGPAVPIAEVARMSGFSDLSHFNRAFRTRFGDTPSGARGKAARAETLRFLREARAVSA